MARLSHAAVAAEPAMLSLLCCALQVLIKSSTRFTGYVLVQMLLDAGAAYGAFVVGTLLGGC